MKIILIGLLFLTCIGECRAQNTRQKEDTYSEEYKMNHPRGDIVFPPSPNTTFNAVEQMPSFPGGTEKLNLFILKNLKWPKEDGDIDIRGKVFLQFVVEKNGRLTHFNVIRSPDKYFSIEAIRVMKKSPKWIPGKNNNKSVRCYYTLPINFEIQE